MKTISIRKQTLRRLDRFSVSGALPSLPQVILKVRKVTESPNSTVADLANIILSDHQLTTRVLRMANSVYCREFSSKVKTVTQAIMLMGFQAIRELYFSLAIYHTARYLDNCPSFDFRKFWSKCLGVGVIAKRLAQRIGTSDPEEVFTAGFLCDIGQPLLATISPDEYENIIEKNQTNFNLCELEQEALGMDHQEAGAWLATKWKLPANLIKPIENHHRIDLNDASANIEPLTALVAFADELYPMVIAKSVQDPEHLRQIKDNFMILMRCNDKIIDQIIEEGREDIIKIASGLNVEIPEAEETVAEPDQADTASLLVAREVQLSVIQNLTEALTKVKTTGEALSVVVDGICAGLEFGKITLFKVSDDPTQVTGVIENSSRDKSTVGNLKFDVTMKSSFFYPSVKHGNVYSSSEKEPANDQRQIGTPEERSLNLSSFATIPVKVGVKTRFVLLLEPKVKSEPVDEQKLRTAIILCSQVSQTLEKLLINEELQGMKNATQRIKI